MLHTYLMMKDEKKCKIYGLFQLYFSKAVEPQKWYCGQSEEMIAIHHSIVKNQKKKINYAIIPLDTFRFFASSNTRTESFYCRILFNRNRIKNRWKKKDDPIFWIGNEMISFPKDLFHLEWVILSWRCTRLFHSPRNRINEKSHD